MAGFKDENQDSDRAAQLAEDLLRRREAFAALGGQGVPVQTVTGAIPGAIPGSIPGVGQTAGQTLGFSQQIGDYLKRLFGGGAGGGAQ